MTKIFRFLVLLGCSGVAAGCAVAPALPDRCGPEYDMLTGRNIGEFDLPRGLPHRVLQPGASATEDFNPARLNIYVDEKGWIGRVTCG